MLFVRTKREIQYPAGKSRAVLLLSTCLYYRPCTSIYRKK